MKKAAIFLLALMTLFLAACGDTGEENKPENTPVVLSKGEGFEIAMLRDDNGEKYSYTVKTHDGTVIESAVCAQQPQVKPLNEDLLGIRFYTDNDSFVRYYDLKSGKASVSYFGAFWDNGKLLAYNDFERSGKLIVCDIFDDGGYRYEKEIESDAMELTVTSAEVNEDGDTLVVKYKLGEHGYEQNVKLPLSTANENNT